MRHLPSRVSLVSATGDREVLVEVREEGKDGLTSDKEV
jgi:hypothetical protein